MVWAEGCYGLGLDLGGSGGGCSAGADAGTGVGGVGIRKHPRGMKQRNAGSAFSEPLMK